jgi:tripartite-type tricarboxylate transporter receptor subunit TctC
MKKSLVTKGVVLCLCLMMVMGFSTVYGEDVKSYPSRPIKLIIPHKAGSSTDVVARTIQPYFQKYLGKNVSVVVENVEGGGGNRAHVQTYKAAPDGYTLELAAFPSVILGQLVKDGKYNVLEYTYLYNVTGRDFNGIFVKYDSPHNNLKSLVDAAKTSKITMSGSGIGTNGHMAMKLLEKSAGVTFEYVSFDGGTEAAVAVAGGHTVAGVGNVVALKELADEKKIKVLAVCGSSRHPSFPQAPTSLEAGYANTDMDVCVGIFGPPNMPPALVKKIADALSKATNDPAFKKNAEAIGSTLQPLDPVKFKALAEKIYNQAASIKDELMPK